MALQPFRRWQYFFGVLIFPMQRFGLRVSPVGPNIQLLLKRSPELKREKRKKKNLKKIR